MLFKKYCHCALKLTGLYNQAKNKKHFWKKFVSYICLNYYGKAAQYSEY